MYVYSMNYDYYDDYARLVLQSKIKYTREQLYGILYDILFKIYQEEEYPPLPCLLDWGDVLCYMAEEPYKSFLRKEYYLVPFDFDICMNLGGRSIADDIDNAKCRNEECVKHRKKYCKWRK